MRYLLSLLAWPLLATTTVTSVQVTSTQAILRVSTDQSGSCSFKVSEVNDFGGSYAPVHDVNTSFFSGSDQCSREGNIDTATYKVLVIGKRTAETASNRRYSRALAANTRHFYQLVVGSDTITGQFVTGNITLGNTRNDPRFDRANPGQYNYPSINWADKSVSYVDPTTGLKVRRASGPGEISPLTTTGRTLEAISGTGWTGLSYSGTSRGYLYLRMTEPSPAFGMFQSLDAVRLVATLSGTLAVEVCLTINGVSCAGAASATGISGSPTAYTIGSTTPILDFWRNGLEIPVRIEHLITGAYIASQAPAPVAAATVTKSGTSLTWTAGRMIPEHLTAGSLVTLGTTDCALASLTNQKAATLANSGCVADGSYTATFRTFGFLVRAATADSGTITVGSSPTWTSITTGSAPGFGSGGASKHCSPVKVTGPGGEQGWLCGMGNAAQVSTTGRPIFFFGENGTVNPLGYAQVAAPSGFTGGTCDNGDGIHWDHTVAGRFYCTNNLTAGGRGLFSVTYTGDYSAAPMIHESAISPVTINILAGTDIGNSVAAFSASDSPRYADFDCLGQWRLIARQSDDLILGCWGKYYDIYGSPPRSAQDMPAWVAIWNIPTSQIIAAMSTYGGDTGAPNRWAGVHSISIAGDQRWVLLTLNQLKFGDEAFVDVSSGALGAAPWDNCPSNTVDASLIGTPNCSTITVATLTPTVPFAPGGRTTVYGEQLRLGDGALVRANDVDQSEIVRILTITGNTLVVQRNYRPYMPPALGLGPIDTSHTGTLKLRPIPGAFQEMWWDYVNDPHATDTTNAYLREDPHSSDCHQVYEHEWFLLGCTKTVDVVGSTFRQGALPASFANDWYTVNWDASFAGSTKRIPVTSNEAHPSAGQYVATDREKKTWFDARPYSGDETVSSAANVSNVSGQLWKVAAAATSGLQYRLQGLIVLTGHLPLVDVSPAVLGTTSADNYKYCFVVVAGDCRAGSTAGEIYFNVPFLTTAGAVSGRFRGYPDTTERDITVTQNTHTAQTNLQAGMLRKDAEGATVRRLGTGFAPYKLQSTFWNNRSTPNNQKLIFGSWKVDMTRDEIFVADLPPFPQEDSTNRGHWVPVTIKLHGVTGDEIRVRFGYRENGPATSFFCHERQVACATNAATPLTPLWTDETQSWAACDSGCTVNVPAIGGRVLYYVIDRRNGGNTTSSAIEAVAVP